MARSTGLAPRRARYIDARTVIVGAILAGARGQAAATRDGSAMLLTTPLNEQTDFNAVIYGQSANAAGGYVLQAAHVPVNGTIGDAVNWAPIATLQLPATGFGNYEVAVSGAAIRDAIVRAGATGTVRAYAVRARPGSGNLTITNVALTSNVATVTVGTHSMLVGEVVTVGCSNAVFSGIYTITAVAATTISYAKTNADVSSAAATGNVTNGVAAPVGTLAVSLQPDIPS